MCIRDRHRMLARRSVGVPVPEILAPVLDKAAELDLGAMRSALAEAVETGIFPSRAVASVLPLEAACLRERTRWLADNADPYSMKVMARLLPRLRIYDELADRLDLPLLRESHRWGGATLAHARCALRARARGETERARVLATAVTQAWVTAEGSPPAVREMRDLLATLSPR